MTILDEWTQDSVWYNALAVFEKYGKKLPTRKYFKGLIRTVCSKLGVTREQIGIVAAPWAVMYYKGDWTLVSFDAVDSLAENGTDIIFIEKLDQVKVHGKHADKYGIALVNSHGHLVDYAEDLARKAKASGAHVGLLGFTLRADTEVCSRSKPGSTADIVAPSGTFQPLTPALSKIGWRSSCSSVSSFELKYM
jgi:hypothetical protein